MSPSVCQNELWRPAPPAHISCEKVLQRCTTLACPHQGEAFPLRLHPRGLAFVGTWYDLPLHSWRLSDLEACSFSSSALLKAGGVGDFEPLSPTLQIRSGQICVQICPWRLFLKVLTLRLLWLNLAPIEANGSQAKALLTFATGPLRAACSSLSYCYRGFCRSFAVV